jgi:hypothetical protein
MDFVQTLEGKSAFEHQVEDPVLLSTFQNLADTARGYTEYTNEYGSVDDWNDIPTNEKSVFQSLADACTGYTKHGDQKTSADSEFLRMTRAGLNFIKYTYHPPPAKGIFFEMARAGMKAMEHSYSPPPMDMLSNPPLPDALLTVYRHMGYQPIEDVIFLDTVSAYEHAHFRNAWGSCSQLYNRAYDPDDSEDSDGWDVYDMQVQKCGCRDEYAHIPGLEGWRTFPTAITHMDRFMEDFENIRDYVFYDLGITCSSYLEYSNDFDDWNDPEVAAFREFSEVAGSLTYVCPDWFQRFLQLPGELRESIIHEYALMERDAGRLSEHQHYDEFHNPCCKWEYPKMLIACDNQDTKVFPDASTGRCPKGWLPNLAFVNHRMHEEVLVLMLQRTERFDLKYIFRNTNFKIATWFTKFLKAIPGNGGENAVKHLNFPHLHWFNHQRISPALTNPSLQLAVACKNLRKLDMTFHVDKVTISDVTTVWERRALPLAEVINRFKLETIFGCTRLEEVYIDGIHIRPSQGGKATDLDVLENVGKWMMKSFLVQRSPKRGIQVELVRRWGCWNGRVRGDLIVLEGKDMAEVKARIKMKGAYTKALSLPGPTLII